MMLGHILKQHPLTFRLAGVDDTPRHPRLVLALVILVVALPPEARLVAPLGCAVEPRIHAPDGVHSA